MFKNIKFEERKANFNLFKTLSNLNDEKNKLY